MRNVTLFRKRIIPQELICLEDDIILKKEPNLIITKWNALKPRSDISMGFSAYFIEEGFKISKVYNHNHEIVYWYCDIITTSYEAESNSYIFTDLLVDILVYEDNRVEVVDLDEVGDALQAKTLSPDTAARALYLANNLLQIIYQGNFFKYQNIINALEQTPAE